MSVSFVKVLQRNSWVFSVLLALSLAGFLGAFTYIDHRDVVQTMEERYVASQKESLITKVHWLKEYIASEQEKAEVVLRSRLQTEVDAAEDVLFSIIDSMPQDMGRDRKLELAKEALRPIRFFDGRGYCFILDEQGVLELFPIQPELEGQNMLGRRNQDGVYLAREMIDLARNSGNTFYRYVWTKPDAPGSDHPKIAYIKHIPELGIILGAGEYYEDYQNQVQAHVLETLDTVAPNSKRYFFAGTFEGLSLLGPAKGMNMIGARDIHGVEVVKELIRTARNGGGFVSYDLPAVDKEYETYPKLSYVDAAPEWEWYFGVGLSLEDMQAELAVQRSLMRLRFIRYIAFTFMIILFFAGLLYWQTRRVASQMQENIQAIGDSFQEATLQGSTIPYRGTFYAEFRKIRDAANELISAQLRQRHLKSIQLEISQRAQSANTLDDLLGSIHQVLLREIGANNFFVALIDEERDRLEFKYCVDETLGSCPVVENISDSSSNRLSLLPIKRNDRVLASKTDLEALRERGEVTIYGELPETWLGIPLRVRGKPIGVMVIQDYEVQASYSKEEMRLVGACSEQIALGIERKRFSEISEAARDIFNSIPSGVYIYQYIEPDSLILVNANPAAEAMTGVRLADWKGYEFAEIWPKATEEGVKDKFMAPMLKGYDSVSDEVFYEDGEVKTPYLVRTFFLPGDKLGVAFENIQEREQAQVAIRESEEFHRAFFQDNHSVILVVDPRTGQITDTNKAAAKYYGYSHKELVSKTVFDLRVGSRERTDGLLKRAMRGEVSRIISKHRWANGVVRDVEVFTGPFRFKGEIHLISIVHDITDRIRKENELAHAKNEAEVANRTKDEFLANISHEVRTPLNGVMGMLQLVNETHLNEEQAQYVSTALESSKNLLSVLNDVLDFSKIEAGKLELRSEAFDIESLLKQCVNLFRLQLDEKKLTMNYFIHPKARGAYIGDPARIRQILFNLLGNSVKFTQTGFISVDVFLIPSSEEGKEKLFFAVEDTGIGIPADKLEHIFETFAQVDGSLSRRHQGTGLGLPIVKRLVGLMGGSISVESDPHVGSTFAFCVTLEKADAAPLPKSLSHEPPVGQLKILLVEDDRVNRLMARKLLEKRGHTVTSARNGEECLERVLESSFDLVLMDMQMPIMDGIAATKAIRTDERFAAVRDIPIVALTAHAQDRDRKLAMDAGMSEYLRKPFEQAELDRVLWKIMN